MTRDALLYNLNKHRYTMLDGTNDEYRDRILAAFDAMQAQIDQLTERLAHYECGVHDVEEFYKESE